MINGRNCFSIFLNGCNQSNFSIAPLTHRKGKDYFIPDCGMLISDLFSVKSAWFWFGLRLLIPDIEIPKYRNNPIVDNAASRRSIFRNRKF